MNKLSHFRMNRRFALIVTFLGVLLVVFNIALVTTPALAQHGGGGGGGGGGCGMGCGSNTSALSTFTTNDFSGSGNCAMCHSGLRDAFGNDVSIDTHWRSTMMANSAKDPLWQAKIESEVSRNPALQAIIEDKCSRCHTPMARTQAAADGTPVAVLGDGFLAPTNSFHAAAMDSVSCSLCHQIQNAGLGTPDTFTGHYMIDTNTIAPDRLIFGKFSNPMTGPMRMHVGYTPVKGNQTTLAGLCGSCHTLYTPTVDAAGNVLGEFPEQMTYLEWRHSEYGDGVGTDHTCQQCHQPVAQGKVKISNRPMRLSARSPFEQHFFVGANAFMLNVLKSHTSELGVTTSSAQLDATLARLTSQLQTNTASLAVTSAQITDGTLSLQVNVQNKAGHKLPSGIPARRAWLYLTVQDAQGRVVFESGRPLADGRISGNDADLDAADYEPHYDVITSPEQVQIYEPVMLDSNNQVTLTLLRAARYAKDNRLLPAGFNKNTAGGDIAVLGEATADANFTGGSDRLTFLIPVQGATTPLTIKISLLYQEVSYPFANDLRQDGMPLTQRFVGYYDQADKTPAVIANIQYTLP